MKKTSMTLAGILAISFTLPAFAGPNWSLIHKAEALHKAEQKTDQTDANLQEEEKLRDFGPRKLISPWAKKEEIQMRKAQLRAKKTSLIASPSQPTNSSHA